MPKDKIQHAAAGALIAALACPISPAFATLAVLVAAVGKEIWDARGRGTPDPWDAVATLAGGATVIIAALII